MKSGIKLSNHQELVYEALQKRKGPTGAYDLLGQMREYGMRGPQQIYRALNKLIDLKLVHRLDSINAFIACGQHEHSTRKPTVFMICQKCGHVDEFHDADLANALTSLASDRRFKLSEQQVELSGTCQNCQKSAN